MKLVQIPIPVYNAKPQPIGIQTVLVSLHISIMGIIAKYAIINVRNVTIVKPIVLFVPIPLEKDKIVCVKMDFMMIVKILPVFSVPTPAVPVLVALLVLHAKILKTEYRVIIVDANKAILITVVLVKNVIRSASHVLVQLLIAHKVFYIYNFYTLYNINKII